MRITFSSDLRKPCWITGESLSPKSKKCPVLENNHIYTKICLCVLTYDIMMSLSWKLAGAGIKTPSFGAKMKT